ncbi:winged helix-turn-helix domain-containing protein [Actinomadura sp. WAC 06369]|uniref:winged helix-turn-helix domain-containing protein n=1 Tax=Actinomadura sp. WAC 06369 TaxID=2203193 RepID=UPI000F766EE7|nr:winged helix-turn-helix domain-containing protein [Actinomadura sp. WAC 06369]RSN41615.1 GntR family transcriptional regulator [Actinomadura sp. WAC 06369]
MGEDYPIEWDPTRYRYEQIADHIAERIASGAIPPRAALPAIDRLAAEYGVARMTIIRATEMLQERGLVRVLRGRGTFVVDPDDAG